VEDVEFFTEFVEEDLCACLGEVAGGGAAVSGDDVVFIGFVFEKAGDVFGTAFFEEGKDVGFVGSAFIGVGAPEVFVDVPVEVDFNEGADAVFEFAHDRDGGLWWIFLTGLIGLYRIFLGFGIIVLVMDRRLLGVGLVVLFLVGGLIWWKVTWAERKVKAIVEELEEVCVVAGGPPRGLNLAGRVNRFGNLFAEEVVLELEGDGAISSRVTSGMRGGMRGEQLQQIFAAGMQMTRKFDLDVDYDEVKKVGEGVQAVCKIDMKIDTVGGLLWSRLRCWW